MGKTAIITRTKNRPLLLERAIKSVIQQSSNDYLHIILNDGGDKKVLEALLSKYPDDNRTVVHNDESAGHTRALNQAIKAVDSDYIAILDDDDTWHKDRNKLVSEYLDANDEPAVAVYMDKIIERIENGEIIEEQKDRWLEGVQTISLYRQCIDNLLSNGCITYRRGVYEDLGGYDESLPVAEDWDFGIRLLLQSDVQFLHTEQALTNYHHRPTQNGDDGNSVFAGVDDHMKSLNMLRNKYLREDLSKGKLGVGYIMNSLSYDRERDETNRGYLDKQVIRLEGHINYIQEKLSQHMRSLSVYEKIKSKILK